ncbi:DUF2283 domain-containing protein [Gloeocapsa sp. PCC 73106]|uniref:DUF2283 domain-containing protein n=1 Tax=Gloeocapsa sp. PCC 73106 TaxID=102232 RepID=UPI0002ABE888|nr:DUF2283 domain-containing protein [Gloeocapsa sp. PCC 73106]ELR98326.1 uncharacterized conserved small protein [Gloeocapsa sp. PCC 73106]
MNIAFDPEANAIYMSVVEDAEIVESETIAPGIIYDFDQNYRVVGIEILYLNQRTPEELKSFNFPYKISIH